MTGPLREITETPDLDSALSALWQRHRQTNLDRISLLETTAANVLRTTASEKGIEEGAKAAHMLAGSLGTFGFDAGSRAALEAEYLLRDEPIDGLRLAEAVVALRSSVQEERSDSITVLSGAAPQATDTAGTISIVSDDANLVSRFTVEATALALTVDQVTDLTSLESGGGALPAVVIDNGPSRRWTSATLLESVQTLSERTTVVVLSERESFDDRAALAQVGATGVVDRSHSMRHLVSFLSEAMERRRPVDSVIRICNANDQMTATINTLSHHHQDVVLYASIADLWQDLEVSGGDLLVVGHDGPTSGPQICRLIRAHSRWHRLPVLIIGDHDQGHLAEALESGADDYMSSDVSAFELGLRIQRALVERRMAERRSDIDALTATLNRAATERSLDRLFHRSMLGDEPFALVLARIDGLDRVRSSEGSAVGDEALRRLGARLISGTPDAAVVGRWADSSFAVGIPGMVGAEAARCVAEITRVLTEEGIPTTLGSPLHCSYSVGATSAPIDGSTFASLERMCETALQRATAGDEAAVVSGIRPHERDARVVDVVLVEDDDSVADVIEHALGLHQYTFLRFSDGAEAAAGLGDGSVKANIVLLDVGLPSLDGFGVLQVLRSKGVLADTRVVMLTARSSEAEMLRALGLGAMEHITKPFSIPVLLGRLDQTRSLVLS